MGSPDAYNAMANAALRLSSELEFCFSPSNLVSEQSLFATLPERNLLDSRLDGEVHRIITQSRTAESDHTALMQEALDAHAAGWPAYMVASSESLRGTLNRLQQSTQWTENHTANIILYLRYYMNQEIAVGLSGLATLPAVAYSPSVSRARIVSNSSQFILNALDTSLSEAVSEFTPISTDAPSIASALVLRGKGDPRGILTEALQAREAARPLRKHLASILRHSMQSVKAGRDANYKLRLALREINLALKLAINPNDGPKLPGTIVFDPGGGVIPDLSKMIQWMAHKRTLHRITVLTEFAKTLTDFQADPFAYARFQHASTTNAAP